MSLARHSPIGVSGRRASRGSTGAAHQRQVRRISEPASRLGGGPRWCVMDRITRMRLDMINAVYAFSQKHKADIVGYVDAVRMLGEKLTRAKLLAAQQETAELQGGAATAEKDALRAEIEADYLVHMVRIARVSLPGDPALRALFRKPRKGINRQAFVAAVRAMLVVAASRKALFIAEGMAETFVEDLEALLVRYLGALDDQALGDAQRVGAVAELPEVTKDAMALVRRLDAINRKRWQKNPELLAAWRTTKDVTWPRVKPEPEVQPEARPRS